jgi:hypothetical protein
LRAKALSFKVFWSQKMPMCRHSVATVEFLS